MSQEILNPHEEAEALLAELNSRFAVVQTANRVLILGETAANTPTESSYHLLCKGDFATLVATRKAPGESRQTAANWWLNHAQRREFRGIVFAPGQDVPDL